ncbi:MAG: F0F1 ATP synthase subunit B [Akkermansiaceae bacterium]|jgi:F-type H+-transporting ATPase subunit b|nr:F0F1 ATP synthase subunit B [Akkermansiaceae bacterium]|tara:strand:- start:272 stop:802 length:531 start_codon:yes stop_codon:yes gene_type:complete
MISILAASGAEQGFFATYGVNWPFFIAQLINFILVLLVLKKFAFEPIQEILDKRRTRIADGEAKLEEIQQQLADSEKEKAALLEKANADAKRLIGEAKESAAALSEKKSQEAVATAQNILNKAQEAAKAERATMAAELKQEFGRLVVATTSQVTGKSLDASDQKRINDEAVASLNN